MKRNRDWKLELAERIEEDQPVHPDARSVEHIYEIIRRHALDRSETYSQQERMVELRREGESLREKLTIALAPSVFERTEREPLLESELLARVDAAMRVAEGGGSDGEPIPVLDAEAEATKLWDALAQATDDVDGIRMIRERMVGCVILVKPTADSVWESIRKAMLDAGLLFYRGADVDLAGKRALAAAIEGGADDEPECGSPPFAAGSVRRPNPTVGGAS